MSASGLRNLTGLYTREWGHQTDSSRRKGENLVKRNGMELIEIKREEEFSVYVRVTDLRLFD